VAWWRPDGVTGPAVLTGSHLDSVLDGGAFDGPLGVVAALAAVDELRARGVEPAVPLGVSVFVEEEGSRFGLACLGSRLATGATSWSDARERRDRDGVALPDALAAAGLDVGALEDGSGLVDLSGVECFVELHVEQGRDLVDRGAAVGVGSEIWPHGRYRFDFTGEANHAGTTRMEDRRDAMRTSAMTALAADEQARIAGQRATFGRLEVAPNGTNAVPSRVTAWLDARCSSDELLADLVAAIEEQGTERAGRDGTALAVTAESVSASVAFDPELAARISAIGDWPVIPTQAGHDAGILSAAGIPSAMLFVRNPTGVSHSPAESAETVDCLSGVEALADTLTELAR
jgi:N-carbamoyl-L-amino-acid hydrolase